MEIRNIQKTGGASYTITLPKDWIKKHNLSEKSEVQVFLQKRDLLGIRPHKTQILPKSSIILNTQNPKQITREVIALYVSGVNEIEIIANPISYEQRSLIREISNRLLGFELFDATTNSMVLKNVANNLISASEYISKMSKITLSMYEDMQKAILLNDKSLARDVVERDLEVDRIQLIITRKFNALLYTVDPTENSDTSLAQTHCYEHIAIRIERIADHTLRIANTLLGLGPQNKILLKKPEKDRMSAIFKYLKLTFEMVNSLDKIKAREVFDFCDSFDRSLFDGKKMVNVASANIIIDDSVGRIKSYMKNIAEETMNYFAAKNIEPLI